MVVALTQTPNFDSPMIEANYVPRLLSVESRRRCILEARPSYFVLYFAGIVARTPFPAVTATTSSSSVSVVSIVAIPVVLVLVVLLVVGVAVVIAASTSAAAVPLREGRVAFRSD